MLAEKGKARCLRKIILSDVNFGMFVSSAQPSGSPGW